VAEQTAVLVGAVLLVLCVERAPLPEDCEAEEYEQTDGPSVRKLGPSRHSLDYTGSREAERRGSASGYARPANYQPALQFGDIAVLHFHGGRDKVIELTELGRAGACSERPSDIIAS
jgi:hypothetical protein